MKKEQKGFVEVEITVTIIAIIIFSTLIISLMYNNFFQNTKLKKEGLAIVYITETFEKIGMASYDEVLEENMDNFLPEDVKNYYEVSYSVNQLDNQEQIIKKISVTLSYKVGNKTYNVTMQRLKAKE